MNAVVLHGVFGAPGTRSSPPVGRVGCPKGEESMFFVGGKDCQRLPQQKGVRREHGVLIPNFPVQGSSTFRFCECILLPPGLYVSTQENGLSQTEAVSIGLWKAGLRLESGRNWPIVQWL